MENLLGHLLEKIQNPEGNLKESKKDGNKGFTPTGIKIVQYMGSNHINIHELEGNHSYLMEYLNLVNILKTFYLNKDSLDKSLHKILNYHSVIYDFNSKKIFIWNSKDPIINPIGKYMTFIKENYGDTEKMKELSTLEEIK